jgi:putative FmdB family regulatory protein
MPTYEYACKACGEHLEVAQSFKDDALTKCPSCGGELRKVFGSIGIVFKGSGFYKNDSRSSHGASKTASAESGSGSEAAAPATPSEATKPAAGDSAAAAKSPAPATPATTPAKPSSGSTSSSAAAAS